MFVIIYYSSGNENFLKFHHTVKSNFLCEEGLQTDVQAQELIHDRSRIDCHIII